MTSASDELMLLERVFLRLGAAESDDQLQSVLAKFLPPVLLKLSSTSEAVRKKVMELLIHVNKRTKARPLVQLPVEALLTQYQDPEATSFVTNFTIIYIKSGFPRLSIEKQAELVPIVLNALENKPQSHRDSLLLLIVPILGKVKVPFEPVKATTLFGLNEKPQISKHFLDLLLDMLLLPYGALSPQSPEDQPGGAPVSLPVPPGMSENSFKRITTNNPMKPEALEEIKLGIVKFLAFGVFKDEDILIHLVVAAADTRFSVANLADMELKKVIGSVDWGAISVAMPLYVMFLGTQIKDIRPELKKSPASTRIRLKLLTYLGRVNSKGFVFPACVQVIFDSLHGTNTNTKLKTLALHFLGNIIRLADDDTFAKVVNLLGLGLKQIIETGEEIHQGHAYVLLGMLAQRNPKFVYTDISLLATFFKNIESASPDLKLQIREGLLTLIPAYKYDIYPDEADLDRRLTYLFAIINLATRSEEAMARFAGIRALETMFPPKHAPSKLSLLISTGDLKDDVSTEARKSLYGTRRNEGDTVKKSPVITPDFSEIVRCIQDEAETIMKDKNKTFTVGSHVLPFNLRTFVEILIYLRLCLLNKLEIDYSPKDLLNHPCESTPLIRNYLIKLNEEFKEASTNPLLEYLLLIKQLLMANPSTEALNCMVEMVGCLPQLYNFTTKELNWIRDQLSSTKEEIRESTSTLYSLVLITNDLKEFDGAINYLINQTNNNKSLETQHGAILALGSCFEQRILTGNYDCTNSELLKTCVNTLVGFLKNTNPLLVSGACSSLGQLGRCCSLPLDNGEIRNGSPDAKRPANLNTKMDLVTCLMDVMNNKKFSTKVREKAARALGLICIGEEFPHTQEILQGLLNTAKETKDVEVHFTVGESLVMACQGVWSPEARNPWTISPSDYKPKGASDERQTNENLQWLLDELLKLAKQTHPNSRQASCIWLLAILKSCGKKEAINNKLQVLQNTFMDLLCENNDIVQDVASKGLCVIYDTYKSEDLLSALVKQLTSGTRQTAQVTSDTKLFEEEQLGKSPTGGNLTTYKELCSLASDLNKPDLIYQFMHLANHNAIWNSKKGAAFGFSSIAEQCGEDLKAHLPLIIPKLYRYQFDPTPNIQASMHNIWRVLVTEPQKTLDEYFDQILADLLENLNSGQYRVRQSCCLALEDFLKGSGNRTIHDCINSMNELWSKLFRVMDDHHEATRFTAIKTAKTLSKLCIRACNASQGKDGVKMVEAILPPLLNIGITNTVDEIRLISLQTISELVGSAGSQLKPFLPKLIPALLQATGELESMKLSYLSTMLGAQAQAQEAVDSARASFAKSHFTTATVSKSLQYADASILEELIPRIVELLRGSVGLGTRIACSHFITLLIVQMGQDIQPYTGKLLGALVNGLTDRNAAVRKHYASAIGHLVGTAKESSLEKLFSKLQDWYFEREDDSIRSAIAFTIQSIGIHNQEILKTHSTTLLPLVFFAMHSEKTLETQKTLEVWTEIWSEHSPGTESGIRQNIERICEILKMALESPSWNMKAQAANAVATVASKLGSTMDSRHRNALIQILLNGLAGRTWNGKDKLLKALASICSNCKESIAADKEIDQNSIIEAVLKESRKEETNYKNASLKALGEILSSLEIDQFDQVYEIIEPILGQNTTTTNGSDDEGASSEEVNKRREDLVKLHETAYETLGLAWPKNSVETQKKYREMFVEHCLKILPTITRSVQHSVIAALYNFVDKLILLNCKKELDGNTSDLESLNKIIDNILKALDYAFGIAKHTRLRKEALNVGFCLGKKLKDLERQEEFDKLRDLFERSMGDLSKDTQPEIKSRLTDIKNLLI